MASIRVRTPATTANLGAGFDCLGMALQLYNELSIEVAESGMRVEVAGEGAEVIPRGHANMAVRAMEHVYERIGRPLPPLSVRQENAIPLTRGLGSSSAVIVAGLAAANALAGCPFSTDSLVDMAAELDGHPDNAAACLLGGLVVSALDGGRVRHARAAVPDDLRVVLYIPAFEMSTREARRHLPRTYSRQDATFNLSRAALTVAALASGRYELLRTGMQDRMHQPYRARIYPEMPALIAAALDAGACGAARSGAGPPIIALTGGGPAPISRAVEAAGTACGLTGRTLCTRVDCEGARVFPPCPEGQ